MILSFLSLKMNRKQKTSDPHIWLLSSQPQTIFPGSTSRCVSRHMGAARVCSCSRSAWGALGRQPYSGSEKPAVSMIHPRCAPKSQNSAGIHSCQV